MEKNYTYKNATVCIISPTKDQLTNIHKATELYLTRLIKEGCLDGNSYKTRSIDKK